METPTKMTSERFAEGYTIEQYMAGMTSNKELFHENYSAFDVLPQDVEFFANRSRVAKIVVLAEDWCGDAIRYVPVAGRLAEAIPGCSLRVFYRDDNLDLAENWKKHGQHRAIPVIVFFDSDFNELACFIEKPSDVYSAETGAREAFVAEYPDRPDTALPSHEMTPETGELYAAFIRRFRAESLRRWQQMFIDEVKSKLLQAAAA